MPGDMSEQVYYRKNDPYCPYHLVPTTHLFLPTINSDFLMLQTLSVSGIVGASGSQTVL